MIVNYPKTFRTYPVKRFRFLYLRSLFIIQKTGNGSLVYKHMIFNYLLIAVIFITYISINSIVLVFTIIIILYTTLFS